MIKTLKAKWRKNTVRTKLNYLKDEWLEGRATQTDVPYWEKNLGEFKEVIVPRIADLKEELAMYERVHDLLQYEIKVKEMSKRTLPVLILAGIKGDISQLKIEVANQKQHDDVVVVLGDFLSAEDEKRVEKLNEIMDLALDDEIVFLISRTEKEALLTQEWPDIERGFIERLPLNVDTEDFAFYADAEGDGVFRLDRVLDGHIPNLSQKLFVYRSEIDYAEGFKMNEEKRTMALNQGLLLRLDVREEDEQ